MKRVLFSLPLLCTIIGLGSSSPIPERSSPASVRSFRGRSFSVPASVRYSRGRSSPASVRSSGGPDAVTDLSSNVCTFLILSNFVATEHESISVDLKCDKPETYNIIKGCNATVEFDIFLDKSTVKSRVRCLEESMSVAKVTTNVVSDEEECGFEKIDSIVIQSGDVVYDVIQYWLPRQDYPPENFVTSLNERSFTAIIPTDGGHLTTSHKGKAMRTNDLTEFRFAGSAKTSWKTNLRFEPKRAHRPQTTIAFIEGNGEIETFDAKSSVMPTMAKKLSRTYDVLVLSEDKSLDYRLLTRNNLDRRKLPDDVVLFSDTFHEYPRDASGTYDNPYISRTDPHDAASIWFQQRRTHPREMREISPELEGLINKLNSEKGENIRSL